MPIIKSAIKNLRKSQKNMLRNKKFKNLMKETIKNLQKTVTAGQSDEAKKALPKAFSVIDRATKKKLLHKNTAARKKSALAKLVG